MLLLDATNLESYLRQTRRIAPDIPVEIRELSGGVSNIVLLVSNSDRTPLLVVKQARQQLRVPDPWFCRIERIWREVEVLEAIQETFATKSFASSCELKISAPKVLFRDEENFLYAMTAAPAHEVWKTQLLAGQVNPAVASACGQMLGHIHAATWKDARTAERFGDRSFFDALRLDPYFRHIGRTVPELASAMDRLIESLESHPRCLVHGDFSPKNILVHAGELTLVDFEVGHFGDPAFDLGFFLSHLLLKAIRAQDQGTPYLDLTQTFWNRYRAELAPVCGDEEFLQLVNRGIQQLAGCMLARVDGKSRVDYLSHDQQDRVRALSRHWLTAPPRDWHEVLTLR